MIDIMARLTGIMAVMSAAEQAAAGKCEYSEVEAELDKLAASLRAAKAADDAEAATFLTKLKGMILHLFDYGAERARFQREADQAKAHVDALLLQVRATCAARIGIHAGVPARLTADKDAWIGNSKSVNTNIKQCKGLREVAGWTDSATPEYQAAVDVQVSALTELEGIMISTAQSCQAGALLNRAVFYVVKKAVRQAAGAIDSAPGSSGFIYYRRTARAIQALKALLQEIREAEHGGVADGSASALSRELENTVSMPNLLKVGTWPSGTAGVGTPPAATDKGVKGDGSDADLGVDGNTGGQGGGVRL